MSLSFARALQICGRVQEASLLSNEGIAQQRASQQLLLKQLSKFMSACGTGGPEEVEANKEQVPMPRMRLLFDGVNLSQVHGWAHTQSPIMSSAAAGEA